MRRAIDTILVNLRSLDIALSRLKPIANERISFGTDGAYLAYRPRYLLRRCVDGSIERGLWNLSCDIAVENTINDLGLTAERLYRFFRVNPPDARKFARLSALFSADDHALWYLTAEQKAAMGIGEKQSQTPGAARKEPDDEEADQGRVSLDVQDTQQANTGEQTNGGSTSIDGDARNRLLAREWKEIARRGQIRVDEALISQYLRHGTIAKNFAIYYDLWLKYCSDYQISDILAGRADKAAKDKAAAARFDERVSLLGQLPGGIFEHVRENRAAGVSPDKQYALRL